MSGELLTNHITFRAGV
ncbi:hypothetical protein PENFLA_c007G05098 [Penicillium flavigenum]|uniref:Uncharacterized protein n=1 Tax=Penicillium flavigenum TaxID=254877 RepID=A0A1V6TKS5_9EURO|nr:hypothetical protein PENFLA_c007G05098 [Penicillium flavigenum]